MINLKKSPLRNDVKRVIMPLLYTLWKYQQTNNPGIDFCVHTKAGHTIECGVIQLASNGLVFTRTLYRKGDPDSSYTDVAKFNLSGLVQCCRNCISLGDTISPGTYEDQAYLIAA